MKTINVITAILATINGFGNDVFSIYNITRSIRDDVNDELYQLEDYVDDVQHDVVKLYFNQLLDNGILNDYSVRYNVLGYREYVKTDVTQVQVQVQPQAQPQNNLPNVSQISQNSVFPFDVQRKMYSYIKNNGPVTMKMIQSRLKGHSCTCDQLKDFLSQLNLVDPNTVANPSSKVRTVTFS